MAERRDRQRLGASRNCNHLKPTTVGHLLEMFSTGCAMTSDCRSTLNHRLRSLRRVQQPVATLRSKARVRFPLACGRRWRVKESHAQRPDWFGDVQPTMLMMRSEDILFLFSITLTPSPLAAPCREAGLFRRWSQGAKTNYFRIFPRICVHSYF
jgi:hypothetical protein